MRLRFPAIPAVAAAAASLLFGADPSGWKDKRPAEWTDQDAHQVITDSPWAKSVTPEISRAPVSAAVHQRGLGTGGVGIGGLGGYGRGGRGGGRERGGGGGRAEGEAMAPPVLLLRWASALPIRAGELKARETTAPEIDEEHYAVVVYGVPRRIAPEESESFVAALKKQAALKREGKPDLKCSGVEVLEREDGPVIVYRFRRSTEITKADHRVDFEAQIGRLKFSQAFVIDEMTFAGKLEL